MGKISVLHVYNSMNMGGAENFIMNVYRKIDRNKYKFYFLCTSKNKGIFDKEIKKLGGKILYFKIFSSKHPLKTIKEFRNILKKYNIDVVHLPIHFFSGILCYGAYKEGIKQIIVHAHSASDDDNKLIKNIYRSYMRYLINKYATKKIACGKDAGKYLFGNLKNVEIMYNGIDLNKYLNIDNKKTNTLKKKYSINKDEIIIGHIGRFVPLKNHSFLIDIAKKLKKLNIKFKMLLIGDGIEFNNIKKMIEQEKLDNVILLGIQKDIPCYMSLFDVFVMPSLYEGFPITIIEALASGVPCVLSDTITREVDIIDGSVKFISLDDDIDKWCRTIIKLSKNNLNKDKIFNELSNNGFSINNVVNRLDDIYDCKQ